MSLTTVFSELWRLLKDNWLKILIGAIIFSILTVISQIFLTKYADRLFSEPIEDEVPGQEEYLTEIYSQEPAGFQFITQKEDGDLFTNSFLFDEYYTSEIVVDQLEEETGVEISDVLKAEENLGMIKTSQYRGSIAGIRNTSSNVITFRVHVGETAQENLKVARWIEEEVRNNSLPFSETLNTVLLTPSQIGELIKGEDILKVSSLGALGDQSVSPTNGQLNRILYAVVGFILGLILTVALLILYRLLAKKIDYAFEYSWDFNDHHFILSQSDEAFQKLLHQITNSSYVKNQIILAEDSTDAYGLSIDQLDEVESQPEEVVILVKNRKTSKKWFNRTFELVDNYKTHKKVIHIID